MMYNCMYCSFETIEAKEKDDHCDKYASIMKKHMNTTTGSSIFNCRTCEFETTKQHILEKHSKSKHTIKDTENWHFTCKKCEKPM